MRIAVFLVIGLIVVFLAFTSIVGAVTYFLVPGVARRTWFRSIVIGEAGSVVGGQVAALQAWLIRGAARTTRSI